MAKKKIKDWRPLKRTVFESLPPVKDEDNTEQEVVGVIGGDQGNLNKFLNNPDAPRGYVFQALIRAWCELSESERQKAMKRAFEK